MIAVPLLSSKRWLGAWTEVVGHAVREPRQDTALRHGRSQKKALKGRNRLLESLAGTSPVTHRLSDQLPGGSLTSAAFIPLVIPDDGL